MFAPLLALPLVAERDFRPRGIRGITPFLIAAAVYIAAIAMGLKTNPRFQEGTFVLSANMPWHLLNSFGRMLFVWGLLALVFLLIVGSRDMAHGRNQPRLDVNRAGSLQLSHVHEPRTQPGDLRGQHWARMVGRHRTNDIAGALYGPPSRSCGMHHRRREHRNFVDKEAPAILRASSTDQPAHPGSAESAGRDSSFLLSLFVCHRQGRRSVCTRTTCAGWTA